MHRYLYSVTTILILSASVVVLCYFISSTEYSFAVNNTSNLFSSLIKQGPAKKITSALNAITPSVNVTRLQQIPNKIAASVEKIKNIVNTTANDVRNSIRKTINDIHSALLDLGWTLAAVGSIVVVAIAIFVLMRRPRLDLDKVHSPLVKTIGLVAYLIDDAGVPFNLRTFEIIYKINTVLIQNKGWKAAKNCKGILNIGNEQVKVYWSAFDERDSLTINAHSVEYLDLFAIVDGEPIDIFNNLSENISKLKSYINSQTFTDTSLRQSLNANIEALSARYKSAEDISRIITQSANYGWRIPAERYYLPRSEAETLLPVMVDGNIPKEIVKQTTRVIVTSENAGRLQEYVTILDKPADIRGTAIRL